MNYIISIFRKEFKNENIISVDYLEKTSVKQIVSIKGNINNTNVCITISKMNNLVVFKVYLKTLGSVFSYSTSFSLVENEIRTLKKLIKTFSNKDTYVETKPSNVKLLAKICDDNKIEINVSRKLYRLIDEIFICYRDKYSYEERLSQDIYHLDFKDSVISISVELRYNVLPIINLKSKFKEIEIYVNKNTPNSPIIWDIIEFLE